MTEHAIIACGTHMVQAINDLRTLGVGVFMDDFGAGYSSLGVLADLQGPKLRLGRFKDGEIAE